MRQNAPNLVYFSKSICIVQLIWMSHCAPEATLEPKRFEFTLKTVMSNVFVVQTCWEAVPNTWPGSSKASVAKMCCACMEQRTIYRGRAESTSWTFRNQVHVVSQVRRSEVRGRDVVCSYSSGEKPSSGILDGLNYADEAVRQAVQQ